MKLYAKNRMLLRISLISLTLTFYATICSAQTPAEKARILAALSEPAPQQTATVKEQLPDGSFIVVINGKELRTVDADKIREIQATKVKLESAITQLVNANEQIRSLKHSLELAMKDTMFAESQRDIAVENAKKSEKKFQAESDLRKQAEALLARRSRVVDFLDSAVGKILTDFAVPVLVGVIRQ